MKWWFCIASLFAGFSVILGAVGSHVVKNNFNDYSYELWEIGIRYMMFHSIALFIVAFGREKIKNKFIDYAGFFFISGILLFSGSLFFIALTESPPVIVTPIGGSIQILGWFLLAYSSFKAIK